MKYEITSPAENDIVEIWDYTVNKWGEKQADGYIGVIYEYFSEIATDNVFCRTIFIEDEEVKYVRCEHHYIFFLSEKKPIILGIIHEKRDFVSVLKKRLFV